MRSVYIPTNSGELHCCVMGEGAPLLLLHGNGESSSIFQYHMAFFSQYYTVIALDTRGHGYSDRGTTKLNFEQFAQDVRLVLDYLHIERTNIIGFSDGGNTALLFAEYYPKRVHALIVVGANIKAEGMKSWELQKVKWMFNFLQYIEMIYPTIQLKKEIVDLMFHQINNTLFDLKNIQAPTLIMAGENDVIKQSHTELIARQINDHQLRIMPKADHFFMLKQPDIFNSVALSFLKKY
ncbi:alpha/beta hydrolase [Desemzia sp. RIT804]|uniref:alpha/beta fold hydrolase n=1 Tax=Desemzia sp. RIT 804 TaxID=2810209 RepID=UPI00194E6FF5|nr:alpha/beta hydrolase [Desemzia sp. RIT 804]MBM6613322.1 alpha/beta hydrolase [Desemzia sp. RIT 804]